VYQCSAARKPSSTNPCAKNSRESREVRDSNTQLGDGYEKKDEGPTCTPCSLPILVGRGVEGWWRGSGEE